MRADIPYLRPSQTHLHTYTYVWGQDAECIKAVACVFLAMGKAAKLKSSRQTSTRMLMLETFILILVNGNCLQRTVSVFLPAGFWL